MPSCHACGATIAVASRIGRRETCAACGAELHCCANCRFYSPGMHNDCAETQAERVVDKRRSNFCDYFSPPDAAGIGAKPARGSTRAQLDELFRKKTP